MGNKRVSASYVLSNTLSEYTEDDAGLIQVLKDRGIDTTFHRYELYAQKYYADSSRYKLRFKCPGDYLAYFSMLLHKVPNYDNMADYFGELEVIDERFSEYPTVNAIADYASSSWWGDGTDYIIYLKNLDTNSVLYVGADEEEYEDDYAW